MKKFLPILFIFTFLLSFFIFPQLAFAARHEAPVVLDTPSEVPEGDWRIDDEVTFVGKNAARSGNLLDFTLENYNWVCISKDSNDQCDNRNNPLAGVWLTTVMYIVTPLLFIVILTAAVIIIITRGRSITIMRFLPRFTGVLLLIFLSFAILQFFYQFVDVIQGFFLRDSTEFIGGESCPPKCISQDDLLFVGWDYENFVGLRRAGGEGDQFAESAFISLLLTKLTALTYYVMVGILVLRKIILWLFIIVSPIFPILLLFYPVRNTGKIWIGEFFRWLLYAPLFAIFLKGLVVLWRNGIPLVFANPDIGVSGKEIYPTAINILLGGPKEFVTPTNSVNLTETFALYLFALIMLWGVIILPWILLQIFLDYASNLAVSDNPVMKSLISRVNNIKGPPGAPAPSPASGGTTINLPFAKKFNLPNIPPSAPAGMARQIPTAISEKKFTQAAYMPSAQVKAQTMSIVSMQLPTIRDIAKYDSSLISNDKDKQRETLQIREKLEKIANPATSTSTTERESFMTIREKLEKESTSGNTLATSILNAANMTTKQSVKRSTTQIKNALSQVANPQTATSKIAGTTSVINREKLQKMNESLVQAKKEGNNLAASILSVTDRTPVSEVDKLQERIMDAKSKGEPIASQIADITTQQQPALPVANRIQTVSREDYEEVEKMWEENYRNLEVPSGMAGTRSEWIKDDIVKIDNIVSLLTSVDQEKVSQGMDEVSSILPFLLVGGFSKAEIVSYLHAKQDAGKKTIAELALEEEQKVEVQVKKKKEAVGHLTASVPESLSSGRGDDDSGTPFDNISSSTQPIVRPQVSSDLFAISDLKLPKLTDIVQYEIRHLTKDKTESERIEKIHEVLERLNSPESIASAPERAQYQELRAKLALESEKGDPAAGVILSAVTQLSKAASDIELTLDEIKVVLSNIVNPSQVSSVDDRNYYTRLHEYLEREAKENNNTLATKVLNVNKDTSSKQIKEISEQLLNSSEVKQVATLPQIATSVREISNTKQLREFVKEISSTNSVSTSANDKEAISLRESLKSESAKGNQLASNILSVNQITNEEELISTFQKIKDAAQKGDQLASSVISQTLVPTTNVFSETNISNDELKEKFSMIANPADAKSLDAKNYYSSINQYLKQEAQTNNDSIAQKILSVNKSTSISDIQNVRNQLAAKNKPGQAPFLPLLVGAIGEFAQVRNLRKLAAAPEVPDNNIGEGSDNSAKIHESLLEEKTKGNKLASSILSINDATPDTSIIQLSRNLRDASEKGDPMAKTVLSHVKKKAQLASANRLQKVTPEDYADARALWEKAYKQYFVPQGFTEDVKGRIEWIDKDAADIEETINLLSSSDSESQDNGMKKVSTILPFLLLGGFTHQEVLTYLRTKLDAARSALQAIREEEENSVSVPSANSSKTQEMKSKEAEVGTEKNK